MFNPPTLSKVEGPIAAMTIGTAGGGTNWPGGSFDPETNIAYLYACNSCLTPIGLIEPPPNFKTDVRYIAGQAGQAFRIAEAAGAGTYADAPQSGRGRGGRAGGEAEGGGRGAGRQANTPPPVNAVRGGTTVQGMPLVKPPYSTISAISLSKGEIVWQIPHGETPDVVRNHPALKGMTIPRTGQGGFNIGTLVTKTMVVAGDGQVTNVEGRGRGAMLRAYDKQTGKELGAVLMPAAQTGSPMTYTVNGKQYIVVAVSGGAYSGEYLAFALPHDALTTTQQR